MEILRTATRRAFEGLVDRAIDERVDFMVIAGDLYDGAWKDFNTGLFFVRQMGRLRAAGIRAVVLHGNHDAESELTRSLKMPDNVRVFGTRRAETVRLDDLRVALHGQSFPQREVKENLALSYPAPAAGWLNIGVLHTALAGREGHAPYAPCTVEELRARGYGYWALGHVHQHEVVCQEPWIVFPGNLQGRHARETGPRGAVLVEADGEHVVSVTRVICDVLRWEHVRVDVEGAVTMDEVVGRASAALGRAHDGADDRAVAARVTLHGRTAAHGELFGNERALRAEVHGAALALGAESVWVEKLRVETEPPWTPAELDARGDAISDLRAFLESAPSDVELMAELQRVFDEVGGRLHPEVRNAAEPLLTALREQRLDEVIRMVAPALLARVSDT